MGSITPPLYTSESPEGSFMTGTQSQNVLGGSQELRISSLCLGWYTIGFNQVKYHSRHLRVYSWRCPTKQMDSGESAPAPLKPSKKQSAAHAAEAKSYRTHTMCGRGLAVPSGLVLGNSAYRTGCVTDSFKGLFILLLISKECKSLTKPTKGCFCKKE